MAPSRSNGSPPKKPRAKSTSTAKPKKPATASAKKPAAKASKKPAAKSSAKATKKPAAKSGAKATKKPAAKATKKPAAKGTKKSRPAGRPAVTSPVRRPRKPARSWSRWFALETGVVLAGVAIGLSIAGYTLWRRAERDVDAWMTVARTTQTAEVLSAPMTLRVGEPATIAGLTEDLQLAGYAHVDVLEGVDQFRVDTGAIHTWTGPYQGPGTLTEGRGNIRIIDGRIAAIEPDPLILRPTVLARPGDLQAHRTEVSLDAVSPWLEKSILAMEDARFRDHGGVDPIGILRAVLHNLSSSGPMHGGSTLTQQLAKNLFLTQERSGRRKVREIFFAAALENRLGKDRILELYMSEVYLGQVAGEPVYGVEQAARAWFGTSSDQLNLAQAATIAGVISSPNTYSPVRHPEKSQQRRDLALDRLEALDWATDEEVRTAKATPLTITGRTVRGHRRAPWSVDHALEKAESALGPDELTRAGYQVHTSIQPHLQRAAERAVREGLAEVVEAHPKAADAQAALIVVRASDGAVVAHVGSRSYDESPFDRATDGRRQAGSTVKPLTLLAALDHDDGLSAASTVIDEPISRRIDGKPWTPRNADGQFKGKLTLRQALEQSRNVPMVKLAEEVGPQRLQSFYRSLGLTTATNLPSAALGAFDATPLELAGAYTVFPGGGDAKTPRIVTAITNASGAMILQNPTQSTSAASARASAQTTQVLRGVLTHGTLRRAKNYGVSSQVGGKTGTTDEGRDAWVAGVTPTYSVAVWVGRDKGAPLGLSGARAALPIWGRMISDGGLQGGRFALPRGLAREAVCRDSGRIARDECPHRVDEVFTADGVPSAKCDLHGGPVVDAGRFLGRIFGRKKGAAVEGAGGGEAEVPQ